MDTSDRLPEKPRKHQVTEAGDRSVLYIILQTIMTAQREWGAKPDIVKIDAADAHLLAKELSDRRLTGLIESRRAIEAKIKDGKLTLFDGVRIGVVHETTH